MEKTPQQNMASVMRWQTTGQFVLSKVLKEFILTFIVDGTLYKRHFANIQSLEGWEAGQRNQPVLGNGRLQIPWM